MREGEKSLFAGTDLFFSRARAIREYCLDEETN